MTPVIGQRFFYFSTEFALEEALIAVVVARTLTVDDREFSFLKSDREIKPYGTDTLLVLPKSLGETLFDGRAEPILVYVMDGASLIGRESIGPSELLPAFKNLLDWGGLARDRPTAEQWCLGSYS